MKPIPSAEGLMINWVNYKTGLKHISFKLSADTAKAVIAIEIAHADSSLRYDYFERFLQLKKILQKQLGEPWLWAKDTTDENGRTVSRIYKELPLVNIANKDDWPSIISFLKPRLLALDEFWSMTKEGLE